jgi:Restriction alleviation protein Lar
MVTWWQMITDADLLPCPFCGGAVALVKDCYTDHNNKAPWLVFCSTDGCIGKGGYFATKEELAAAWNKRAPSIMWRHYTVEELNAVCDCLISIMHPRAIYDADQLQMANTVISQAKVDAQRAWDILERNVIPDDGNLVES